MTNTTTTETAAKSTILRTATEEAVAYCAEHGITDPDRMMGIMGTIVQRLHAELRQAASLALSDTDDGRTVRAAIMSEVLSSVA